MLLVPSRAFENATSGGCGTKAPPTLPLLENTPAIPAMLPPPPPPLVLARPASSHADLGVPLRPGVPALPGRLLMRRSLD